MGEPAAEEQLSAYLDGELEPAERQQVETRLQADPELRAELAAIREAADFLRTHGPARAPDDLLSAILDQVADEPMPAAPTWWDWLKRPFGIPLEGLAVAAAAAGVMLLALPDSDPGPSRDGGAPATVAQQPVKDPVDRAPAAAVQADEEAGAEGADALPDDGVAAVELEAPRSTPKARPRPSPRSSYGSGAAPASKPPGTSGTAEDTKEAVPEIEPEGTPEPVEEEETAYYTVPFSFVVTTGDPEVLLRLQRLVGTYQGRVLDPRQRPVKTSRIDFGLSEFYVEIPGRAMSDFQGDLGKLGKVIRYDSEQGLYPSDAVMIKVAIQLEETSSPKNAAPPQQKKQLLEPDPAPSYPTQDADPADQDAAEN